MTQWVSFITRLHNVLVYLIAILSGPNTDYTAITSETLTFTSGNGIGDRICREVELNNDEILESNERFMLKLTSSDETAIVKNTAMATVIITEDTRDGMLHILLHLIQVI